MLDTGGLINMEHERKTIRYQSITHERITSLINRVDVESLKQAHKKQKVGKAVGIDGETKEIYDANLERNLSNLVEKNEEIPIHTKASKTHIYTEDKWKHETIRDTIV